MSVRPPDQEVQKKNVCGFLFAFYNYSTSQAPQKRLVQSFVESFVHWATQSDNIHVAVLAAPHVVMDDQQRTVHAVQVHDKTYTAFVQYGFVEQLASAVMNRHFTYMLLPVNPDKYQEGIHFLESLKGAGYNYLDLPWTVLPKAWKRHEHNATCTPSRVFCSQVGLMLCYKCSVLPSGGIDPACCAPGELRDILQHIAGAIPCDQSIIEIVT